MATKKKAGEGEPIVIDKPKTKRPTQEELIAKLEAELAQRKAKIEAGKGKQVSDLLVKRQSLVDRSLAIEAKVANLDAQLKELGHEVDSDLVVFEAQDAEA